MRGDVVGGEADDFDAALLELGCLAGYFTELGGADGSEVVRVGEEDSPGVAEVLVEVEDTAVD